MFGRHSLRRVGFLFRPPPLVDIMRILYRAGPKHVPSTTTATGSINSAAIARTVGRRGGQMQGEGPHLGQCSPNDDVGSQYSFPAGAKCPPGVGPGAATGCAWGSAVPVRTIRASCLMRDRALVETCKGEIGQAPFSHAAAVWSRAFASDDPARGGCPEATPGPELLVV